MIIEQKVRLPSADLATRREPCQENISLSTLKACNAMNWPGSTVLCILMLTSPLTYAVCPRLVHCKWAVIQKPLEICNYIYLHFYAEAVSNLNTMWKVQKILPYALKSENTFLLIVYGGCFHSLILSRVPLKSMLYP